MKSYDPFDARRVLRCQCSPVEIVDTHGVSRGSVEPDRALDLLNLGDFEIFGDADGVRFLRFEAGRDWTRSAEDSLTTVGAPARPERRQHHQARSSTYGADRHRDG